MCLSATVSNAARVRRLARRGARARPRWSWRRTGPSSCATTWPSPRRGAVGSSSCRCCTAARLHPQGAGARPARGAPGPAPRRACATRAWPAPGAASSSRRSTTLAMLPAIVFIFSRAACDDAVAQCLSDGMRLTSAEERAEIRRRCEEHTEGLPDEELRVLGYGPWAAGLEAGLGSHHAGLIPAFREAVEDCFSANLLRVVFATETLSLGINMPARTVVIERLTKIREHGRSGLSSGEYAQMTGRAGRRGLDSLGHAVVVWSPAGVDGGRWPRWPRRPPPDLRSSFRPTYNLAVNLVRRYQRRPGPLHLGPLLRPVPRQPPPPCPVAAPRPGPGPARTLRVRRPRRRGGSRGRGAILAGIYHESDLLVAEALADGIFDGLDAARARRGGLGVHVRDAPGPRRRVRVVAAQGAAPATAARWSSVAETPAAPRSRRRSLPAHAPARRRVRRRGLALGAGPATRPGPRASRARARATSCATSSSSIDLLRQLAVVGRPDTAAAARHGRRRCCSAAWWRRRRARPCRPTTDLDAGRSRRRRHGGLGGRRRARSEAGRGGRRRGRPTGLGAGNRGSATPAPRRS